MLLQTKDISVRRKGVAPLLFPDLEINTGDKMLLLGRSGSGKTTLLSVLAGLLKPDTGHVYVENADFYKLSSTKRDHLRGQKFGFVFQVLHLLPSLTLLQNINLAADMAKTKPENGRIEYLLKTLGLSDKVHRKPDALSQGEQQRAAIARAVLLRPKIILADEPTSALDEQNAETVIDLLETCADETGAALLIATHDMRIKEHFKNITYLENQITEAT
jgi:putative ABC transport system ATP-binding protein